MEHSNQFPSNIEAVPVLDRTVFCFNVIEHLLALSVRQVRL